MVFIQLLRNPDYYDLLTQYQPLVVGLDDTELSARFYSVLSMSEYFLGHFDQTIKIGTKAIEFCKAAEHPEFAYNAYMVILWGYLWICDYDKLNSLKEDVLCLLEKKFELQLYVHTFITS